MLIIWNGGESIQQQIASKAKSFGIPVAYLEVGFFGQKTHYFLSKNRSYGKYLLKDEPVEILNEEQESWVCSEFAKYAPNIKYHGDGNYVGGMLQLEHDYSIRESRFSSMQQLIDEVDKLFPGDNIIFKAHPKSKKSSLDTSWPIYPYNSIWPHICPAKVVIGVNSTSLYEAAFAGAPVIALGDCALSRNPDNHRGVVYELLKRQIPLGDLQVDEQVRRSIGDIL